MTVRLAAQEWRRRRADHERRVDQLVADHLVRRRDGIKHPVADFLFTYYSNRPGRLRRWHPGAYVVLVDAPPPGPEYVAVPGGSMLDHAAVLSRQRDTVVRIRELLAATASRPGRYGCFGLHEWAMVYRQPPEQIRHRAWPLRTDPAPVVEAAPLRCTHFDAFRFFTVPARPRNEVTLTRADQVSFEQPGCLHANMDLYRWAYTLSPLVPGELVVDCFELARDIRTVDMRASPYDLSALGFEPVPVETAGGRAEYTRLQREFADQAAPLRTRLIAECDRVLSLGADPASEARKIRDLGGLAPLEG
jgi:hypothetical protein